VPRKAGEIRFVPEVAFKVAASCFDGIDELMDPGSAWKKCLKGRPIILRSSIRPVLRICSSTERWHVLDADQCVIKESRALQADVGQKM
jgi:hypothetical protein